ncbi:MULTISPECIES: signal transduction protein TRAP [Staphylococcus]|uniref:signal transduction protein TRAP n=1 Tax=Staphylococcus TaxID=1279 RepID=UPI000DB05A16|nr:MULTISPECIES: signal transduction protein TRAP [Staphylococcus]MBN4913373.1 signal transduction protein TRAP [Staphylococcus sp. EG-SA-13]MBK3964587.1 signal transduction protein TRAP [Staphylococcus aureus]MBK3969997.1 signal transduction protein TRAP [Staphylococcus aureus]MBK3978418.1 signal transduction protein TRAP [Staphylococcus aureus]MBK3992109.1 signal transduction protein TRAP [Staphylococcus aureus]
MKKLYTSYGTYGFLHQIKINNPTHQLFQFSASDTSVIFEETDGETVLKSPSIYEVIKEIGEFSEHHFYCAIFIPSTEDHAYQLEKKLISVDDNFRNFGGFKSYRLLRPAKGTTYKIYFGFADRHAYEDFKQSDAFNDHFSKDALSLYFGSSGQHSSYFERYLYPIKE